MGQEDANEDVWSHQDKAEGETQATPVEEEIHQGGQWSWRDSDEPQQQIIDRYREGYVILGTELCYTPQKYTSLWNPSQYQVFFQETGPTDSPSTPRDGQVLPSKHNQNQTQSGPETENHTETIQRG